MTLKSRFGVTQDYWKWQLSIYIAYEFLFVFLQCTVRCLVSMHKRGLCRHAVCVCVSVTFVDSVEMSNRIVRLFSQSGSGRPGHSSFFAPNGMAILRREPPNKGVECRWGRQKTRFWTNICLRCIQVYIIGTSR